MNRKTRWLATGGVAAVLASAAVVPALAQDDGSGGSAGGATATQEDRVTQWRDELASRLAEELGIDEQRVADALDKVREELATEHREQHLAQLEDRLAQAVEDGDLTQAQADAILEAWRTGVLEGGMFGGRGHGRMHGGLGSGGLGGPMGGGPGMTMDGSTGGSASSTWYGGGMRV